MPIDKEKLEDELIKLNQLADLAERLFINGTAEEYIVDAMITHIRQLSGIYYDASL